MKDTLPRFPRKIECGIVNLDVQKNKGTHWVAYKKNDDIVEYFDSFGNLKPPRELARYLGTANIIYNNDIYQDYNQSNCGHLCLEFLYKTF